MDEDFGANSQLQYFILSENNGHFSITLNGTFEILHSLDREVQAVHFVTIIAIDSGVSEQVDSILFCKGFAAGLTSNHLIISDSL